MKHLIQTLLLTFLFSSIQMHGQECQRLLDSLDKQITRGEFELNELLRLADSVCRVEVGENDSLYGDLLNAHGSYMLTAGAPVEALSYFSRAKTIFLRTRKFYSQSIGATFSNTGYAKILLGRFQEALLDFDTSLLIKQNLRDTSFLLGVTLLNRANALVNLGRLEEAKNDMLRSIQNAKNNRIETNSYQYLVRISSLGVIYIYLGAWQEALPIFEETVQVATGVFGEEDPNTIVLMNNLSQAYLVSKKLRLAELHGKKTLQLAEKVMPDHPETNKYRQNLGVIYLEEGKYSEALSILLKAKSIEDIGHGLDPSTYALLLSNIGNVYLYINDFAAALPYFTQAREQLAESIGRLSPRYALVNSNLATCYYYLGNTELGESLAKESFGLVDSLGDSFPDYEKFLSNTLVSLTESDEVLQRMKSVTEIVRKKFGDQSPIFAYFLMNYAASMGNLGQAKAALPLLEQSEKIMRPQEKEPVSNDYIGVLRNLGTCHEHLGNKKKALRFYEKALTLSQKNADTENGLYSFLLIAVADLQSSNGKPKKAFARYVAADSVYRRLTDRSFSVLSDAGREAFLESIRPEMERWHTFAWRNVKRFPEIPGLLFNDELSEKGQLIYSARTVLAALQASGDSLLISRFKQWRDQKQSIAYYYSLPSHQRLFTPLELDSIVQVANLTEASLVQGSDAFRTARAKVNWQNVRDGLQPGEAAIEFTRFRYRNGLRVTDSVYYAALVLRRGDRDPVFVKLFEEKQLAGFLQNCASRAADYKEYVGLAYRGPRLTTLYQLIWQPLESLLTDVHTVWYAPTGLLHRIAFDAIAPETGRPLVKKYDLRLVSSTREVVSNRKLTRDVVQTALLVGGIQYDADSLCLVSAAKGLDSLPEFLPAPSLTVQRGSCENGPVTDIPGTKKETDLLVSKLQSRMYVRLLQGCSAREEAIKRCGDPEKPDAPGLMHIATHGFFCDDPESSAPGKPRLFRSGLLLAGAQRARTGKPPFQGMEDGILYSSEVANLNLTGTKLVVLSACETALGDVRGGDGVYGLPRGFRLAGAEHVMMSLWKISDSETVLFMETLYRHWQPETDIRAAFLATQRELQAAGKGEEVWAAFILL